MADLEIRMPARRREERGICVLSLHYLCRQLAACRMQDAPPRGRDACPQQIELLDAQEVLRADRLYLGDHHSLPLLARVQAEPESLVLLADMEGRPLPDPPAGCDLLAFTCSLFRLYNTVAGDVCQAVQWQKTYRQLSEQGGRIRDVLDAAAGFSGGAVALLDPHGRLVEAAGLEHGVCLSAQLADIGALTQAVLRRIFPSAAPLDCYTRHELPGSHIVLHGRRAVQDGEVLWMLLMEESGPAGPDLRNLCDCTVRCLRRQLLTLGAGRRDPGDRAFRKCWEDIMERRLISRGEVRIALDQMPLPVDRFCRVLLVSFRGEGSAVPYQYVLSRLRDIFPDSNMTEFQKDIVILYSYPERTFRFTMTEDQERQLNALLKRYDGFMSVGNGTHHMESLGCMYLLGKRTVDLAYLLRESRETRIFFNEDYLIYSIIDLCVQRYLESELNNDILYLTHPAVPALTRYDREHHTDLRDVLFYYLLNDCNLTATAASLYMHRNTVNNKVNQIKKIIQLELDEPKLRQRLLLSCQIMRYYEIVMQREMQ